jgi:predicted PurR-regulated permease PerM
MCRRKKKKQAAEDLEAARQAELDQARRHDGRPGLPRGIVILVGLAAASIAGAGMWAIQSIVAPVFLALVLTICVHPLRVRLERIGLPRGLATGSVVIAVFVLLAAFVSALIFAVAQFATLLPQFAPQLKAIAATIGGWLSNIGIGKAQIEAITRSFNPANILDFVSSILGSVTTLGFAAVVVLTCLLLMAVDANSLLTVFGSMKSTRSHLVVSLESYASGVRRYMAVTTALGAVQGVLNALALWALGVPGAFLWGLLTFLCSFIPNIGYFIAIVPPIVFAILVGGVPTLIWVIVLYTLINGVVQSIVQPRVVGNAVALSQTITFVSVLIWAVIVGPVGAILAIPLTLLVRTVLIDSDPDARWWRPIMGDFTEAKGAMKAQDATNREQSRSRRKAV